MLVPRVFLFPRSVSRMPPAPTTDAAALKGPTAGRDILTRHSVYVWLVALCSACLLVADVVGIKLFRIPLPFSLFGIDAIVHTCGMLTFPVTFLLTDLLNEYYGQRGARRATYISFAMAGLAFGVMNISLAMPRLDAPFNVPEEHFHSVFANARIMYVASLCAYLVGALCDIAIFGVLKRLTGGRMIWLRATGSTVISQMVDSFVVTWLAFGVGRQLFPSEHTPPMPFNEILTTGATGYALKFVLAIAITPLIYAGHGILRRWIGLTPMPAERPA
jgi:uncharacterized integral membrane protein (TIGR00697 family)